MLFLETLLFLWMLFMVMLIGDMDAFYGDAYWGYGCFLW
jgi:hypothetical protein